jgi:hypothetical protein
VSRAQFLLVVALELLRPVVAAWIALPWAMEQSVRLGKRILVEVMVPCRLTFAAQTARTECRGKREIITQASENIPVHILGKPKLRAIQFSGHPDVCSFVRTELRGNMHYFSQTYLGDGPLSGGESCASVVGEAISGPADHVSSTPGEEFRESGLNEPKEYGELLARPVS